MASVGLTASNNPSAAQTDLMNWLFGDFTHAFESIHGKNKLLDQRNNRDLHLQLTLLLLGMFNNATGVLRWTEETTDPTKLEQYDVVHFHPTCPLIVHTFRKH